MNEFSRAFIEQLAVDEAPNECCGFIVSDEQGQERVHKTANTHWQPTKFFQIRAQEWLDCERQRLRIMSVFHSHTHNGPNLTTADAYTLESMSFPWHIYSTLTNTWATYVPKGVEIPLSGREFIFGVQDCYSLIRDYYRTKLGICLPNFERTPDFGQRKDSLYEDNYEANGFYVVKEPQVHDLVLMQLHCDIPNHGAVYVGKNLILHHLIGRLSGITPYGGLWLKHTVKFLRHRDVK